MRDISTKLEIAFVSFLFMDLIKRKEKKFTLWEYAIFASSYAC